jgi:hypothetical protein
MTTCEHQSEELPELPEGTRYVREWSDLRTSGLLWLINRVVFHPRGFALGLVVAEDGQPVGWDLLGDGSEPWRFEDGEAAHLAAAEQTFAAERRDRSEPQKGPVS